MSFATILLGGVQVVTGTARKYRTVTEATRQGEDNDEGSKQIRVAEEVLFTAIPYYAWAHRGPGQMAVWLPRTPDILQAAEEAKKP